MTEWTWLSKPLPRTRRQKRVPEPRLPISVCLLLTWGCFLSFLADIVLQGSTEKLWIVIPFGILGVIVTIVWFLPRPPRVPTKHDNASSQALSPDNVQ